MEHLAPAIALAAEQFSTSVALVVSAGSDFSARVVLNQSTPHVSPTGTSADELQVEANVLMHLIEALLADDEQLFSEPVKRGRVNTKGDISLLAVLQEHQRCLHSNVYNVLDVCNY